LKKIYPLTNKFFKKIVTNFQVSTSKKQFYEKIDKTNFDKTNKIKNQENFQWEKSLKPILAQKTFMSILHLL